MAANEASRKSEGREVDRKENTKEKKTSRWTEKQVDDILNDRNNN
jgi:hypothetical protein